MSRAEDYYDIQKLLYRYCYHLDRGDLERMAALFAHARLILPAGGSIDRDPAAIVAMYRHYTRIYPDTGTPKTRHMVGNPIIDIDDSGTSATSHSYIVVFQGTDALSLQSVIAGHNLDRFVKENGLWRYEEREIVSELFGDLSQHMLQPFGPTTD